MIAEIHGKLPDFAQTEDMLTSDVFGALELLGDTWLREWLKDSVGFSLRGPSGRLESSLPPPGTAPLLVFWPNLASPKPGVPSCEPDVLVFWGDLALIIEVKYGAGKSGSGIKEAESSTGERSPLLVDQLGRQWCAGQALTHGKLLRSGWPRPRKAEVLFVTQDFAAPLEDIQESLESARGMVPAGQSGDLRFYWTSCRKLFDVIEAARLKNLPRHESVLLSRLFALLQYKGLVGFKGFPKLSSVSGAPGFEYVVNYFAAEYLSQLSALARTPVFAYKLKEK